MSRETLSLMSRRDIVRAALVVAALVAGALWVSFQLLQPAPPRRIVLASGAEGGLYDKHAQRYRALLARDGVTVDVRTTQGAGDQRRDQQHCPHDIAAGHQGQGFAAHCRQW
jgi:TRAP-type uncharacterized transport system substrate-binding protein